MKKDKGNKKKRVRLTQSWMTERLKEAKVRLMETLIMKKGDKRRNGLML
jgi:hypothetical protein